MEDKEYQKKNLEGIYNQASFAPVFRENPRYGKNAFSDLTPYISYNDIMGSKYIIRARPSDLIRPFDSEEREVIIEYTCLDELVNDGWRLD